MDHLLSHLEKADMFELIVNQIGGVSLVGRDGRYIYVNQPFSEITGYALEELKGRPVRDIFPENLMDKVLATGKSLVSVPYRIQNKNMETVQLISSYYPIWINGTLEGCIFLVFLQNMDQVLELSTNISQLMDELSYYKESITKMRGAKYSVNSIIGKSEQVKEMKKAILRAARTVSTVLIEGETGSGKELVASSVHYHSKRSADAFIKVNCAAIPRELLESEFFGYEPGAFTGASKTGKKGKFELAHDGTLFLDEVNQLPLELQPKLLRAIQEREIERVGGAGSIPVDCRIVAASNVSLKDLVASGDFREDLYYRLNVVNIRVPPLRERKEDIPLLADTLLERLNKKMGMAVPGISSHAKENLKRHDWPGNVRELQNVIERAMNMAWSETITWQHLSPYFRMQPEVNLKDMADTMSIRKKKYALEQEAIKEALELTGGNRSRAAELLHISRGMLYKKMKKYGM